MENAKLNNLVLSYQTQRNEVVFEEIYATVSEQWKYSKKVAQSLRSNQHEVIALYEDVLLKCIERFDGKSDFINFYKLCVKRRRADLYEKNKRIDSYEMYEEPSEGDEGESLLAATIEQIADPTDYHEEATRKADQRQLIDLILEGADEFTTAIVNAFLSHESPTARQIAKEIGVHHSKVSRTFHRLAANFRAEYASTL
ncbi:MAG: hypothetical protein ACQEV7_07590 [Bacillota bacterium]